MTEFFGEIASGVLQIVTALIGIVVSVVIVPWLKNSGIPWLKEKRLYSLCTKFTKAAHKLAETGVIDKATKLEYVVGLLTNKGIKVTPEVRAFIEGAVEELDLALDNGFEVIVDTLEDAGDEDDADEDFYDDEFGNEIDEAPDDEADG